MVSVSECTEDMIKKLAAALRKAALGKPVSFVFEEGVHRISDEGKTFSMPNGTVTFRLFVNGGAKDSGAAVDNDSADTPHPAVAADVSE